MKSLLLKHWDRLRSSFWFIPSLMAACAIGLALGTVTLDEAVTDQWLRSQGWIYTGGPAGASAVLSSIAGSMITIAGVVFSMTLVALTLASSQFGPRLLRNFMRDTANQVVLGTFVGTFLYCLLVLRTIRRSDELPFVPHLSVTLGVVFAIASIGVLIYFIHHVSVSIQAEEIVARVGAELISTIERRFPERRSTPVADAAPAIPAAFERDARAAGSASDGYIQHIDMDGLVSAAAEADALLEVVQRPGDYVVRGGPLVRAWPGDRLTDEVAAEVTAAFLLGKRRTPAQDPAFSINQLVEIAVRALSPGVNDPFTAITCVDRLGSALCRLAARDLPSPYYRDGQQRVRVIAPAATFVALADAALTQIRQNARSSVAVSIHLLDTIAVIATVLHRAEDRAALRHHAELIARGVQAAAPERADRESIDVRYLLACEALG